MTQHSALSEQSQKATPQSEPIPGSDQIENSAGGFTWGVDSWQRLRRFLILGVEGGTYYIGQRDLVTENVTALRECMNEDGQRTVNEIVDISKEGRAPSNDPALFALAYCAKKGDEKTRRAALAVLPEVARIGTHLYHFASYVRSLGGWGRATKRAIAAWYNQPARSVTYQALKYRQRDGWSHRDLLRLSHVTPASRDHQLLFHWITQGELESGALPASDVLNLIINFEQAQKATTPKQSADLIRNFGLTREMIQPEHLTSVEVWEALLEKMPMAAMIRNLATMTRIGLLKSFSDQTETITTRLRDESLISVSRIHPIAVLAAMKTYEQGHGERGQNVWEPIVEIVDALDDAFYLAFGNVEPSGKRTRLALDVSGSMWGHQINGVPGLDAAVGSAAMALVTAKTEKHYDCIAFADQNTNYGFRNSSVIPFSLSAKQRLDDVVKSAYALRQYMSGTDCALPILDALDKRLEFDTFIVYTDNETWAGDIHPAQALTMYRQKMGIDAKLIVVGMCSNGFSIADPNDAGMLDLVGFDTASPNLMSEFARGNL